MPKNPRDRLIDAATRMLAEHGLEAATVKEIALAYRALVQLLEPLTASE